MPRERDPPKTKQAAVSGCLFSTKEREEGRRPTDQRGLRPGFPTRARAWPGSGKKIGDHEVEDRAETTDHCGEAQMTKGVAFGFGFHGLKVVIFGWCGVLMMEITADFIHCKKNSKNYCSSLRIEEVSRKKKWEWEQSQGIPSVLRLSGAQISQPCDFRNTVAGSANLRLS